MSANSGEGTGEFFLSIEDDLCLHKPYYKLI